MSTQAGELTGLIVTEGKTLSPAARARFLAGAAIFVGIVFLMTYGAALAGNHLAQHYLDLCAAPLSTFLIGWLGVRSPFLSHAA